MAARLTPNSIAAINAGDLDLKPVVQVMEVTKITGSQERFQIVVSDGTTTQHALLATQLNQAARAGKVRRGSVVQLLEYICCTVQSRRGIRKRCKSEILTRKRPRKKRDGMPWLWCGENEVGEVNFSC